MSDGLVSGILILQIKADKPKTFMEHSPKDLGSVHLNFEFEEGSEKAQVYQ